MAFIKTKDGRVFQRTWYQTIVVTWRPVVWKLWTSGLKSCHLRRCLILRSSRVWFGNCRYIIFDRELRRGLSIFWCIKKQTKVYSNFLFIKSWRNNFIFLPVLYLVMSLMKAQKNFGKIATLKKWELVSLVGAKTHFGKIDLK